MKCKIIDYCCVQWYNEIYFIIKRKYLYSYTVLFLRFFDYFHYLPKDKSQWTQSNDLHPIDEWEGSESEGSIQWRIHNKKMQSQGKYNTSDDVSINFQFPDIVLIASDGEDQEELKDDIEGYNDRSCFINSSRVIFSNKQKQRNDGRNDSSDDDESPCTS